MLSISQPYCCQVRNTQAVSFKGETEQQIAQRSAESIEGLVKQSFQRNEVLQLRRDRETKATVINEIIYAALSAAGASMTDLGTGQYRDLGLGFKQESSKYLTQD